MRTIWLGLLLLLLGCPRTVQVPDDTDRPDAADTDLDTVPGDTDTTPLEVSHALLFDDVSAAAGITWHGNTYGSGWGDLNQDGLPDLWSGNHAVGPSLYLNQGDGTFVDVSPSYLPTGRNYDAHGLIWIDLHNDGTQELIESVGSQQGTGLGATRVYTTGGRALTNVAASLGLAYAGGSGRMPLAYDWNNDGRLDVLLINQARADGKQPTALFTQGANGSFVLQAPIPAASEHYTPVGAQLADLDGDHIMELVRYGRPNNLSAHDARSGTLLDVSASLKLPVVSLPFDMAIADFDNDLRNDIFYTRWEETSEAVPDADGKGVQVAMRLFAVGEGVSFTTTGNVTVKLDPPWFWVASDIKLGAACTPMTTLEPTFLAGAHTNNGRCAFKPSVDRGLYTGIVGGAWQMTLSPDNFDRGNLTIRSTAPLQDLHVDIQAVSEAERLASNGDRLWMRTDDGWEDQSVARGIGAPTTCTSAAAADFDNDGDLDLFLVCATMAQNTPDLLFSNDGHGNFTAVSAFGAEGTSLGRGDSVALADYDEDGFIDLFVTNGYAAPPFNDGPQQLFHNHGNTNHWIEFDLVGTHSNRDAVGASVVVTTALGAQLREQSGGTHYLGQHFKRLHFGLGNAARVDHIEVYWPDGSTQSLDDVAVNQVLRVVQE